MSLPTRDNSINSVIETVDHLKTFKIPGSCFNAMFSYEVRLLTFGPQIWKYWPPH